MRRDDVCFREASSQLAGDRRLVGRVAEREQRADRYRFSVDVRQRVELERHEHPVRPHPLAHAVAVPESNERLGMLGTQPVEVRAVLPAQMKQMLETGRGDERGSGALPLEQGVRRDRRPVRESLDAQSADGGGRGEHGLLLLGSGRHLRRHEALRRRAAPRR